MCGISAIIAPDYPEALNYIESMTSIIRHRGPDDEGTAFFSDNKVGPYLAGGKDTPENTYGQHTAYSPRKEITEDFSTLNGTVALSHRRLSIIDLSLTGHQPMCTADKRFWIVYNGEVYNYIELRDELDKLGYSFASKSDTEVILASYVHWGNHCLERLNGMFAFVIYDSKKQCIFAARDRFGIKPLYYWFSPKGFMAIASEIKQFTVLPGWKAKLNGQRAYDFLNWGLTEHSDETLFYGVHQFRGGEFAEFNINNLKEKINLTRWYALNPISYSGSFEEAVDEFYDLFLDSIRLRLRSDVPVGSCLSGGLDSSAIVCSLNQILNNLSDTVKQKTFSARATYKSFDEGFFIKEVVTKTEVKDYHTYPDVKDLFCILDDVIWHQDEPFNTSSIFAQWKVFQLAASNQVKVMLDGQGADELLAGYHVYYSPLLAGYFKKLHLIKLYREIASARKTVGIKPFDAIALMITRFLPYLMIKSIKEIISHKSSDNNWLNTNKLNCFQTNPFYENGYFSTSVNRVSKSQLLTTSLPMLLHWEDRNSMAHSIESRVPFLDYRLVEFLLSLPHDYKISEGITKRILRQSMIGILPESVRTRMDKVGFVTPEEVWLKKEVPGIFRKELKRAVYHSDGILTEDAERRLERIIDSELQFDYVVWRMICFGRWMECFNIAV